MTAFPSPEERPDVLLIAAAGNVFERFVISSEHNLAGERFAILVSDLNFDLGSLT